MKMLPKLINWMNKTGEKAFTVFVEWSLLKSKTKSENKYKISDCC
jgi:hypothetical protein